MRGEWNSRETGDMSEKGEKQESSERGVREE